MQTGLAAELKKEKLDCSGLALDAHRSVIPYTRLSKKWFAREQMGLDLVKCKLLIRSRLLSS